MRGLVPVVVVALLGCGRVGLVQPVGGGPALTVRAPDAGVKGGARCTLPFAGPSCCSGEGRRVGSAVCEAEGYVCRDGAPCECGGAAATFHCTDACGSDAFIDAVCFARGWDCPSGLRRTSDCAPGTCWGEPGDCCVNPRCEDGAWTCESMREPCQ